MKGGGKPNHSSKKREEKRNLLVLKSRKSNYISLVFSEPPTMAANEEKGTAKRNRLLELEQAAQEKWERLKVFELDAPEDPGNVLIE